MGERQALFQRELQYTASTGSNDISPSKDAGTETEESEGYQEKCSKRLILGYSFGVLMAFSYAASSSCSQALGGFVPAFQLNTFRFAGQLLYSAPALVLTRPTLPTTDKKELVVFGITGFLPAFSACMFYEATIYLPVGTLGGLEASSLIVLAALMTVVLREHLGVTTVVSMLLAVVGIFCLTQPAFLFKFFGRISETHTTPVCFRSIESGVQSRLNGTLKARDFWNVSNATSESNETGTTEHVSIQNPIKGYLCILGASILTSSLSHLRFRFLQHVGKLVQIFWESLFGTVFSAVTMLIMETPLFPGTLQCIVLLFGHSFTAVCACSFAVATGVTVSPVTYSLLISLKLLFLMIAQYTILKHVNPGHGNLVEILGGGLVLVATVLRPALTVYTQWKNKPREK